MDFIEKRNLTTNSMAFRNRMRLALKTSVNSLQFYCISLITFYFKPMAANI